ncbi:MAG: ABC transporter permease subunit, partial [Bifidobacteriaceae bacterium]|nr:ABC transporter permease subunit [Bifidobacteriaceae bacterium]
MAQPEGEADMKTLKRFARQPLGMTAAIVVLVITLACLFANLIAPYDPIKQDLMSANQMPSGAHLLGTDSLGRDILSRLLYGGRVTLSGSVVAVSVFTALGLPLGLIAGYWRGWLDKILGRLVEVIFATPVIVILLVVLSVFSANLTAAMITLGVLGFGSLFRVVRASTMAASGELYVKAARSAGLRGGTVLRRHILPNLWGQVIVQVAIFAASAILTESGLAFLGFSIRPPDPSWGSMIGEASAVLSSHPYQLAPPGVLIGIVVLSLGLVGDAARDLAAGRNRASFPARSRRSAPKPVATQTAAADSAAPMTAESTTDAVDTAAPNGAQTTGTDKVGAGRGIGQAEALALGEPSTGALLEVRGLSVEFTPPGATVVEDVSFDVHPGEVLGIVGESGSGKTITARALIALLPAGGQISAGSIRY